MEHPTSSCNAEIYENISSVIQHNYDDTRLTKVRTAEIDAIKADLENYLSDAMFPIYESRVQLEAASKVLRAVRDHLKVNHNVSDVDFIAAKISIVQMTWNARQTQIDISYENSLPKINSSLLRKYCEWDCRLAPLGVWIKLWAKTCGIADSSNGSPNSYTWIILVIYYMQHNGSKKPMRHLQSEAEGGIAKIPTAGYNLSYRQDVDPTESLENEESVGQLFCGFLDFYLSFMKGSINQTVIQIRSPTKLSPIVFPKKGLLRIQDPFLLGMDLGSRVNETTLNFIVECMTKSRDIFRDPSLRTQFLQEECFPKFADSLLRSCIPVSTSPVV